MNTTVTAKAKRVRRLTQILGITLIAILVWGYAIQDAGYQIPDEIIIVREPRITQTNPYQEEYEKLLYPVVRITSDSGTGSGVVISNTNHTNPKGPRSESDEWTRIDILTAAHVVENKSGVDIEFYNSEVITGTVVITDTVKDLALIRVICSIRDIRYRGLCGVRVKDIYSARLAPRDYTYYLFNPVYAIGCSLGLNPRPSQGIISAINLRTEGLRESASTVEISAPVLPGNSGGPVYDARTYEVIGIAVWVKLYNGQLVTTMAGIVPISEIYGFLNHKDTKATKK